MELTSYSDLFGRMGIHFLEGLELQDESEVVLRSLLRELAYTNEEIGFIALNRK